jgi:hypothetical protein
MSSINKDPADCQPASNPVCVCFCLHFTVQYTMREVQGGIIGSGLIIFLVGGFAKCHLESSDRCSTGGVFAMF